MKKAKFEWDDKKDKENQKKHNVSFWLAQFAFFDHIEQFWRMLVIARMKADSTVWAKWEKAS
jgi:uncharacterized DUF497 family protein